MHELSLVDNLIRKIQSIAAEQNARKVTGLTVKLGAFSPISPDYLLEHFFLAAQGTIAERAQLNIEILTNGTDSLLQEVWLESITFEN